MGLPWAGQGLALISRSKDGFMLADRTWAVNGVLRAEAGLALFYAGRRR